MDNKIIGKYYTKEQDPDSPFYNEFFLNIEQKNNTFFFELEMTTFAKKGTFGITWEGNLVNRFDHLKMIIHKEIDWVKIDKENKKIQNVKNKHDILDVEIYPEEEKIIIYNPLFARYVTLYKID